MMPDIDLQLGVAIKALESTIAPALTDDNPLASEQCQLAIATLAFVRARLPMQRRMLRAELGDTVALARRLSKAAGRPALEAAADRAATVLDDPACENEALAEAEARLASACTACIEAAENDDALTRLVVTAYARRVERGRAWVLPAGFELDPDSIPSLDTLLDPADNN